MDEGSLQTITALRVAIREHTSGDVTNKLMMIVKALGIAIVTYQKKLETKLIEMETEIAKHRSDLKKSEDKTFRMRHAVHRMRHAVHPTVEATKVLWLGLVHLDGSQSSWLFSIQR